MIITPAATPVHRIRLIAIREKRRSCESGAPFSVHDSRLEVAASVDFIRAPMPKAARPKYKRIVLKLSGEALREVGSRDNISPQIVNDIAHRIKHVHDLGVQVAVVIGGGNIW